MDSLEERKRDLIRKADASQRVGDIETMRYYDREIEKINKILYGGFENMEKRERKLWVVPSNDLEAKAIIEMLERNGENYLVTGQTWGASWEKLEPEIKLAVEKAKKAGNKVYGVELQGNVDGVINVDHHTYGEDDRSNSKSSIEQVAEILGVELTLDEKFIAANDKGFIPAMEKLGEELGISKEDLQEIISNIRMRDRLAQGVSMEQEAQAEEAIEALGEIDERQEYILVDNLPHSKTSTITDRLYGKYENLLVTSTDGETNFYGRTSIIEMLNEKFPGGWSGGQLDEGSGFWGGYADQTAIKQAVQEAINREKQERFVGKSAVEKYWLEQYSKDKIGTIAKLSQAMQHASWLEGWQEIHGTEPRIKPIIKKVNGEKVKIGEANIAVQWSSLPEFFRQGNEYGDIETVKFLSERIKSGKIEPLSRIELLELSERENVKWSDGKHSLNPFQGYLYDFTNLKNGILEGKIEYGKYAPVIEYKAKNLFNSMIDRVMDKKKLDYETDYYDRIKEEDKYNYKVFNYDQNNRTELARRAFKIYYTTRLLQKILKGKEDSKYHDFIDFDITSVTTLEQIDELDIKLTEMVNSSDISIEINQLYGNSEFEREFYDELRNEVAVEIKKDSDRIENTYKVYEALETGDFEKLLEDEETLKWAEERRREEEEQNKRLEQRRKDFIEKNKNRMNEKVAIKSHWAYGAVTLRMTLREALNKGFSIYSIEFENERDDR